VFGLPFGEIGDISPLSSLTKLTRLHLLGRREIRDLRPLSSLTSLTKLDLSGCWQIEDLGSLSSLTSLTELDLSYCRDIEDLRPLSFLTSLTKLNLEWCWQIEDLRPLSSLTKLTWLNVSHCWKVRDKTPLFALRKLSLKWCEKPPSAKEALLWSNMEDRRIIIEHIGWLNILKELNTRVIDEDGDPEIGILLEAEIPDAVFLGRERFLQVRCGTGRTFVLPVPPHVKTALEANAWTWGLEDYEYKPEVRT
jgi:hypothetical protein